MSLDIHQESKAAAKRRERQAAEDKLRELLSEGPSRLYGVLAHRTRSGMARDIAFLAVSLGELRNITHSVGRVLGYTVRDLDGSWVIRFRGCGFNPLAEVANALEMALGLERGSMRYEWI